MINRPNTNAQRLKRHKRVRGKISGTPERPRLNVFRSETNIYAQVIDDVSGKTLVSASSLEKDFACEGTKSDAAKKVGQMVAERAKAAGITTLTAAAMSITAGSRLWPRAPARAAWNFKGRRERTWLDLKENPASSPRSSFL